MAKRIGLSHVDAVNSGINKSINEMLKKTGLDLSKYDITHFNIAPKGSQSGGALKANNYEETFYKPENTKHKNNDLYNYIRHGFEFTGAIYPDSNIEAFKN